jgi:hypothetical protein
LFGEKATPSGLADLLRGRTDAGTPSLLFSGSHRMVFQPDDPKLPE